jgi:hypothetical protein
MKEFIEVIKAILRFLKDAKDAELRTFGGKINLSGGIIVAAIIVCIFVSDFIEQLLNAILSFMGKPLLPSVPYWNLLILIPALLIYFYFCIRNIITK